LNFSKQKIIPRCPDEESAVIMESTYVKFVTRRYSRNGYLCIQNVPIGLGDLFFDHAELGKAMLL
jgi:hypothetical protein